MYAVVFRFGAYQVALPTTHIAYSSFDNVFVAFTALIFGAAGAGQAAAFAPNYAKAKLSANRVFFLLDRVPEIDGYSEEGEKPKVGKVEPPSFTEKECDFVLPHPCPCGCLSFT